jgi:hypothetical protein
MASKKKEKKKKEEGFKKGFLRYAKGKSDVYGTPPAFLKERGYTTYFDPCPHPRAPWDGLEIDWLEKSKNYEYRIYVNPPFSQLKHWLKKCFDTYSEAKDRGIPLVLDVLMPVRTPVYFHTYVLEANAKIVFLKKRLGFIDHLNVNDNAKHNAPFDCWICQYRE